jgi:hypothetical protein
MGIKDNEPQGTNKLARMGFVQHHKGDGGKGTIEDTATSGKCPNAGLCRRRSHRSDWYVECVHETGRLIG